MGVDPLQREIARIALSAAQQHGFALAGGNALVAHGFSTRATEDVDLFSDRDGAVVGASGDVEQALRDAGYRVARENVDGGLGDLFEGFDEQLVEWVITDPSGHKTHLQLAYVTRTQPTVGSEVGPMLSTRDVLGGKVAALATRAEVRDYIDTAAALQHHTVDELIDMAQAIDPSLTEVDFAEAGARLDRLADSLFARYGLTTGDVTQLRRTLASWPRL